MYQTQRFKHLGNVLLNLRVLAFERPRPLSTEAPIRAEIFSVERLEQHAKSLAVAQRVAPDPKQGRPIAKRLSDNGQVLTATYRAILGATTAHRSITPAAEWLLDNFHIVQEQLREIDDDLPAGFYRVLPKLAEGPLLGYPRVYEIAWAIVAHTDSAFDLHKLTRFVEAYQSVQPLTIGELWALAITLRITLIENLRRLAEGIEAQQAASIVADALADRILGTVNSGPEPAPMILRDLDEAPWSTAFAVELAKRLRGNDPDVTPALRWLNDRLNAEGTSIERIVHDELERQSATDVTVRNVIVSMRLVSTITWEEFFESVSRVDAVLRDGSDFAAMDFPTRDLYRRAIEELARGCGQDEVVIAKHAIAAVERAKERVASSSLPSGRETDPGFYLIADGRVPFEKELGCRVPIRSRLLRLSSDLGVMSYLGMIAIVTALVLAVGLIAVAYAGAGGWELLVLAIVGLVPASDVAVGIVNRAVTQLVGGTPRPALELRQGVTADLRTIVVVPTMLTDAPSIEKQVERLEVHHLSNPDDNLTFALVSDWRDSATEHDGNDESLRDTAKAGIARLNALYGPANGGARFFLFHRRRTWNEGEGVWMGWERKRGKLHELNRMLRGATDTTFMQAEGDAGSLPSGIRYVITLDADTRLPIGAARRLVGKMAHALNKPDFDPHAGRVVRGHAMLQPRVTPSLPLGSEGSLFQRVFSGPNGLDPYALAVSDVYQDLFEEGSYCGKGIYEIDSFEAALDGQIPENAVLSHDLLEGVLARAGLVSDIEVVEEFPSRYGVATARQHRWVRGDWQLLPWIFGFRPRGRDGVRRMPLPLIGRWKMIDNLRRSLSAPAALLALLIAWLQPVPAAAVWTAFILLTILMPPLLPAIVGIIPHRAGVSLRNHLRGLRGDLALGLVQGAFLVTFLAHQAWVMVDAVVRTLFRLFIRRRHLLEWMTAAQATDESRFDSRSLVLQIVVSLASAAIVAAILYSFGQRSWAIAAPFVALWMLSPLVARWSSLPPRAAGHLSVTPDDTVALRLVARRTWSFFEEFVTAEDNMLPPDNFQEDPKPVVAHRTSPTNLGLYLLSVIAARDFGWLGTLDALDRLESAFASMAKLERFRGHFYNWYDTTDLRALEPKYVSSVDSGNLAAHLITLGNACREIVASPIGNGSWKSGLDDALALVRDAASCRAGERPDSSEVTTKLDEAIEAFAATLRDVPSSPPGIVRRLSEMAETSDALEVCAKAWSSQCAGATGSEVVAWTGALRKSVLSHKHDFDLLTPWAGLLAQEALAGPECDALTGTIPTLAALPEHCRAISGMFAKRQPDGSQCTFGPSMDACEAAACVSQSVVDRLAEMATRAEAMANTMEFGFLFDADRQLLSIGYRGSDGSLDANFYDLLASEARLASFVAIAKGDLPAKHWFRLGRTLTPIDNGSGLISWSGSMFEYLMPSLVMRAPAGSLLEQTNRLVVWRQENYGNGLGVPWGMSESEYNVRDIEQTYQYSSFGVPNLGYKRGLGENTVIAPYATGLAAMIDPAAAARNFRRLADAGARGIYRLVRGARLHAQPPAGRREGRHHSRLHGPSSGDDHCQPSRTRFSTASCVRASTRNRSSGRRSYCFRSACRAMSRSRGRHPSRSGCQGSSAGHASDAERHYGSAHSLTPRTHLLSNGNYSTMVTAAGSGYSRWHDVAITRWREDVTRDNWGAYVFLRDVRRWPNMVGRLPAMRGGAGQL